MIIGYARISTPKQVIDRQIRNIKKEYPDATIISEAYTGTSLERPQWQKLYNKVNTGDTIIFDEVSRMSRNAAEGYEVYENLFQRGVNLVFLKEPYINTDTYKKALEGIVSVNVSCGDTATDELVATIMDAINTFMMNKVRQDIYAAFEQAEKEVKYLRQRTKEGIETARINGKQIGGKAGVTRNSPKKIRSQEKILKHSKDFGGTLSDKECIALLGISRNSYYKYKSELAQEIPCR